ncbi:hypothetical protein OG280_10590 [Streptomyces virginiae]|uniref:hypothetical protein n=1 Tax=Streptomyces virginiae TaxID=1961 RepID=UPI00324D0C2F
MTAATSSPPRPPAFLAASRHHFHTAKLASDKQLRISADHLAGLAAECAIKAILVDYLGSVIKSGKAYNGELKADAKEKMQREGLEKMPEKDYWHGHLPEVWGHFTSVIGKRQARSAGPDFSTLLGDNPFDGWNVAHRYCDDAEIPETLVAQHLQAARILIAAHEQARTLGTGRIA